MGDMAALKPYCFMLCTVSVLLCYLRDLSGLYQCTLLSSLSLPSLRESDCKGTASVALYEKGYTGPRSTHFETRLLHTELRD